MRRKQGFTLVELLVVMAIIAILAAIVVPNTQRFIARARVTRALSEVSGMETAITAMLTDAGRSQLSQLFLPGQVPAYAVGQPIDPQTQRYEQIPGDQWPNAVTANFERITEVYSNVIYDLLRYGRDVLRSEIAMNSDAPKVIDRNVLAKLGTNYMDLGNDPWGGSYRIFPGPWKFASAGGTDRWPIVFRRFSVETGNSTRPVKDDAFVLRGGTKSTEDHITGAFSTIVEDFETWPGKVGFPADAGKSAFIWSLGENMRNGQMIYSIGYDPTNPFTWYQDPQDGSDLGGGDDINNWDKDATWARFTN